MVTTPGSPNLRRRKATVCDARPGAREQGVAQSSVRRRPRPREPPRPQPGRVRRPPSRSWEGGRPCACGLCRRGRPPGRSWRPPSPVSEVMIAMARMATWLRWGLVGTAKGGYNDPNVRMVRASGASTAEFTAHARRDQRRVARGRDTTSADGRRYVRAETGAGTWRRSVSARPGSGLADDGRFPASLRPSAPRHPLPVLRLAAPVVLPLVLPLQRAASVNVCRLVTAARRHAGPGFTRRAGCRSITARG
jgi:hypothetical protein